MATVLFLIFLMGVLVDGASRSLPLKELRRRARSGNDSRSRSIYKAATYGSSLRLFTLIVEATIAVLLILMAADYSNWLAAGLIIVIGWLISRGRYLVRPDAWTWFVASLVSPILANLLSFLRPVLLRLESWIRLVDKTPQHTGLYEREDLLELIKQQNRQIDNRLTKSELKIVEGTLTFGDKLVGQIMTPRRSIKFVVADDAAGPHLMDELHASGFSRFPVVKEKAKTAEPQLVGTLYLRDLVGYEGQGRVRDIMKKEVYYINEGQNLRQALAAIIKTHHHLLIVVNDFEEVSGVLSLEDVIEQILGEKIVDEFDRYDDLRAVAAILADKERHQHSSDRVVE